MNLKPGTTATVGLSFSSRNSRHNRLTRSLEPKTLKNFNIPECNKLFILNFNILIVGFQVPSFEFQPSLRMVGRNPEPGHINFILNFNILNCRVLGFEFRVSPYMHRDACMFQVPCYYFYLVFRFLYCCYYSKFRHGSDREVAAFCRRIPIQWGQIV